MANRIHDAFDSIQADDRLKETTKQFIQARAGKKSRFIYRAAFQGTLMFACMALVLAAGISGYSWIFTPVSYVNTASANHPHTTINGEIITNMNELWNLLIRGY